MGNCSSIPITINLDGNNSFYFTGQTITGNVGLSIPKGNLEANEIYISLNGQMGYTTIEHVQVRNNPGGPSYSYGRPGGPSYGYPSGPSYGRPGGPSYGHPSGYRTETRTVHHSIPFYVTKVCLLRPENGKKYLTLPQGAYSWPFQFQLTDHLPPTVNQPASYPHVKYYLQVMISKAWYKANTRETKYLTISPRVNILQQPQYLSPVVFENEIRKNIKLKGTLNKLGYVPGELITATLEIENPKRTLIKSIDFSMIQSFQIGVQTRENTRFQTTIPTIMARNDAQIRETYSFMIPFEPMPPTYQYQGGTERMTTANVFYRIKFAVKVEEIATDFNIDVPIVLGTEPIPALNQN